MIRAKDGRKTYMIFTTKEFNKEKSFKDLPILGVKTFFCSNVCAAYKKNIYDDLGGFIKRTIFNEDMIKVDTDKFSKAFNFNMNEEELSRLMETMMTGSEEKSYSKNLITLGYQDLDDPSSISIYFKDFNR